VSGFRSSTAEVGGVISPIGISLQGNCGRVRNGRTFVKKFSTDRSGVFFSGILEMTVSRAIWWGGDWQ